MGTQRYATNISRGPLLDSGRAEALKDAAKKSMAWKP